MRPTSLFDAGSVPEHSGNFSSLPNMSQHRRYRKSMIWISLLATGGGILALGSCSSPIPNRNPIGESFPVVRGESLNGDAVELPSAVSGEPAILMVGYVQGTQFDLDRWTLGFAQAEAKIRVVEVPAVVGWFPNTFLQGTIDDGMRAGIPAEDWARSSRSTGVTRHGFNDSPETRTLGTAEFSCSTTEESSAGSGIRAIPRLDSWSC